MILIGITGEFQNPWKNQGIVRKIINFCKKSVKIKEFEKILVIYVI